MSRRIRVHLSRSLLALAITACASEPIAPLPVARVLISPVDPLVVVTDTVRLTATGHDANGTALTGRTVQWSSSDATKATVSTTGVVTATSVGLVEITATIEQQTASTTISVVPAPVGSRVNDFFMAFSWPGNAYTSPIPTQPYYWAGCPEDQHVPCLNENVYRQQWNGMWDWQTVAAWAADPRHRGHLYTLGDDEALVGFGGLYIHDPRRYAADYCAFVSNVQKVDPTAEFGTSMLDVDTEDWWLDEVVDGIVSAHKANQCGTKPISEWTFNIYGHWSPGAVAFEDAVQRRVTWALTRPAPAAAPLALGCWVLGWIGDDIPNDHPAYLERLREVKAWLFANPNIRMARYLSFEPWVPENPDPHPLADAAGHLNASGRAYAEVTGRIAGPIVVRPGAAAIWTAETTAGPPPFTYEWLVNGVVVGRHEWLVYANAGVSFGLQLRVTDGSGGRSTATINVAVEAGGKQKLIDRPHVWEAHTRPVNEEVR